MFIFTFFLQFLLASIKPKWAILLVLLALPTYMLRTTVFGIPTTYLELMLYATFLGVVVRTFFNKDLKQQIFNRLKILYKEHRLSIFTIIFFLLVAFLAVIFTKDLIRSLGVLKGWYFDPVLAGLIFYLVGDKDLIKKFILSFSGLMALISWYGIIEYFTPIIGVYNDYVFRLNSIFTSANYHSMLVAPITVVGLWLFLFRNRLGLSLLEKLVLGGSLILNFVALVLTVSFGAYLGVAVAILVLIIALWRYLKVSSFTKKAVTVVGLGLLVIMLAMTLTSPKLMRDLSNLESKSSLRGRTEIWATSIYSIKANPILGVGLGNFDVAYEEYVDKAIEGEPMEAVVIHAHNLYLNFWNEAGVFGFLALLLVIYSFFSLFLKSKNKDMIFSWGLLAAMIVMLGHGIVDTPYYKNDLSILFWFWYFAMLIIATNDSTAHEKL